MGWGDTQTVSGIRHHRVSDHSGDPLTSAFFFVREWSRAILSQQAIKKLNHQMDWSSTSHAALFEGSGFIHFCPPSYHALGSSFMNWNKKCDEAFKPSDAAVQALSLPTAHFQLKFSSSFSGNGI